MSSPGNCLRWALALLLATAGAPALRAEEGPHPAEALLARSHALLSFQSENGVPFQMCSTVRVSGLNTDDTMGTHCLTWQSRAKWRKYIRIGEFQETQIADGDKLWTLRSMDHIPYRIWQLRELFQFFDDTILSEGRSVGKKVRRRKIEGEPVQCVEIRSSGRRFRELCFTSGSGDLRRSKEYGELGVTRTYQDPVAFGPYRIPSRLEVNEGGKTVLDVHIDWIKPLDPIPETMLAPPPGSAVRAWCADPTAAKVVTAPEANLPLARLRSQQRAEVWVYAVIGLDGQLGELHTLYSTHRDLENAFLVALGRRRYEPATCDGIPVERETVLGILFRR